MERTLKDLSVEGVKTRKKPNKHIVFAVKVMWSDGQVNVVSRKYSEFFELMEKLNETFPVEAGKHDNKRILPNLQAKKTFLLSSSVMKQLERITYFTKNLVHLPDHISQCYIVRTFFTPTEADIESTRRLSIKKPKTKTRNWRRKNTAKKVLSISGPMSLEQYRVIADVAAKCKTGLDLKEGQTVEIIEKLDNGWWLVTAEGEQGWVPASYLSNEHDPEETMTTIKYQPGQGECYVTSTSYTATFKDELSFDIGVHLQVIEKNLDGWWKAIYNGCEGLVPAAYLKKVGENKSKHGIKPPPVRKANVLSQRHSVSSQGDMTVETLAKLRESTFKSPEEKEERMSPKRKLSRAEPGKLHLELKKSVDGGWVPQVIPATQPQEKEKKLSQDKEKEKKISQDKDKGFSLLKGFGYLKKSRRDDETDDKKTARAKKSHVPQRSKSAASDFKSMIKLSPNVVGEKGKVVMPVEAKQAPRRKSMVEELLMNNSAGKNEKATQQKKSLDGKDGKQAPRRKSMVEELMPNNSAGKKIEKATQQKKSYGTGKYYQRWSSSEENDLYDLPWKNVDVKNEYVLHLGENSGAPKFKTRSLSELCNAEFSATNSSLSHKKQVARTEQNTCCQCKNAPVSDSPVFLVTPPTPQLNKKPRKMSEQSSNVRKKRLNRKKSYSCSDLASLPKSLEDDTFDDHEDSYLDEDWDSSDEDICTLEDLLNEERESKGGFYYEDLPDDTRKMSKERGSFDSGIENSSPPLSPVTMQIPNESAAKDMYAPLSPVTMKMPNKSAAEDMYAPLSPVTMKIPNKSAADDMYVAIADYEGSKEHGEVDLFEGKKVRVLKKTVGGWWLVVDDAAQKGWAPSNFLKYCTPPLEGLNKQRLDQTFCYVGDGMQSVGVSEDIERSVIQLPNGEELQVVDKNNNGHFMLVRVPSKFAWISKSCVFENDLTQCKI